MAGVTAASDAESAMASRIALRFDDMLKSTPIPMRPTTGTRVRANTAEKLPPSSRRKRLIADRRMGHPFASDENSMGISHIWKLTICVAITRPFEGRLKENSVKIRLLRSPKNLAIAPQTSSDRGRELARRVTRETAATS